MRILGNIVWLIFGGLATAVGYFVASIPLIVTVIGIPFALQTMKLSWVALWPFGKEIVATERTGGCLTVVMNILWLIIGGIWICLTHLFFGILLMITIIGIPWGIQHFKLAGLALSPFGKEVAGI
jgi:uncharacterized membrane protein YccF (DUF307 family)